MITLFAIDISDFGIKKERWKNNTRKESKNKTKSRTLPRVSKIQKKNLIKKIFSKQMNVEDAYVPTYNLVTCSSAVNIFNFNQWYLQYMYWIVNAGS